MFGSFQVAWDGVDYTIPPERVMRAIAVVEDCLTLAELHEMLADSRKVKIARVSHAWGELLRFAGASVTDEQVYEGMFRGANDDVSRIALSLMSLLKLMVPDSALVANEKADSGNGNRRERRAAIASSKKRTKRPAALAS